MGLLTFLYDSRMPRWTLRRGWKVITASHSRLNSPLKQSQERTKSKSFSRNESERRWTLHHTLPRGVRLWLQRCHTRHLTTVMTLSLLDDGRTVQLVYWMTDAPYTCPFIQHLSHHLTPSFICSFMSHHSTSVPSFNVSSFITCPIIHHLVSPARGGGPTLTADNTATVTDAWKKIV